jgi:3D (Asp-Asp-Asp) domain-containing protein
MPKVLKTEKRRLSAYNSEAAQTDASPCITANGFNVCKHGIEDTVAANSLPFGARIRIPELFGDRVFVVRDRMNPRYKNNIDIWFKDKKQAINFGRRTATVEILDI